MLYSLEKWLEKVQFRNNFKDLDLQTYFDTIEKIKMSNFEDCLETNYFKLSCFFLLIKRPYFILS